MDVRADDGDDGQWLTHAELATVRGISTASAIKLALRHHWRKQKDNRGTLRCLVPPEWSIPKRDKGVDDRADLGADARADISGIVSAFEAAIGSLTARAESRADAAERGRDAERARADRLDQALTGERARADALRDRIEAMQVDAASLQAQLATAEAEGNSLTVETAELTAQVKAAKAEAREAQEAAEELRQADAARRARGVLARLRAGWRGE